MSSFTDRIDALLAASVAAGEVPGVIATVGTADEVLYEGAAGVRAAGGDTAMTTDTVVWIASMTKAVTGTAALVSSASARYSVSNVWGPVGCCTAGHVPACQMTARRYRQVDHVAQLALHGLRRHTCLQRADLGHEVTHGCPSVQDCV